MKNKKIIFMGTPVISANYLNALINQNIKIDSVFTQPPSKKFRGMKIKMSPVHEMANKNKINVFHPKNFGSETIKYITNSKPDLIIVMAYGKILPKVILELPKFGCINVHVSILPRWRGASPIEHSLMNGDIETGISIIKLVEKLDAGPIIAQDKITIPPNFNKEQLTNSLEVLGIKLLINTIPKIFSNKIVLINQNDAEATYANKITTKSRQINFNNSTKNVLNQIRAHAPKPGAWFYLNKERIKIFEATIGNAKGKISTVINNNFDIACNNGSIQPKVLQREGKKIVTKDEFLRGFNLKVNNLINE